MDDMIREESMEGGEKANVGQESGQDQLFRAESWRTRRVRSILWASRVPAQKGFCRRASAWHGQLR